MEKRIRKIFLNIEKKPDAILIYNSSESNIDYNFFYVTKLKKGLFEGCCTVLFPDGNIDLIVSKLESESAGKTNSNLKIYNNKEEYDKHLSNSLKNVKTLGMNFNSISHFNYLKIKEALGKTKIVDISRNLDRIRMIKDEEEINKIRKAAEIADKVAEKIPDIISKNMKEYELAAEINYLLQKYGADSQAFDTISSFGANSSEPHYTHGNKKLNDGDIVLCDFGARVNRYNSDITRTFIYGNASEKQKEIYETVKNAQKAGLNRIKTGEKASIVHDTVEKYINLTKYQGCFIHSTGHSLGLEVHDGILGFRKNCDIKLEKNMVLTVEPGIYLPGYGGVRIEDDIIVKDDGYEFLTKSKRDLIEIKR